MIRDKRIKASYQHQTKGIKPTSQIQPTTTNQPKKYFRKRSGGPFPYSFLKLSIQTDHKTNFKPPAPANQLLKPKFLTALKFLFTTQAKDQYNFRTGEQNQTFFITPPTPILFSIKS
jgi:hypothetical protein